MSELRARLPALPASVPAARRSVVTFAATHGFARRELEDIETAAGEALANALEHGNRAQGFIELFCGFNGVTLTVEVRDRGAGFLDDRSVAGCSGPGRGWGIFLMRSVMDRVSYRANGSIVRLEKRLPRAQRRVAGFAQSLLDQS